jgi:hypothetical protein
MALDSMDKLVAALAKSERLRFYKPSIANATAGQIHSLWRSNGFPTLGAIPGAAAYCNHTTDGSWPLPTPGAGEKLYLAKLSGANSVTGQLLVADRLAAMGGLSGASAAEQTVNLDIAGPAAAGRCSSDGAGVLWGLEWYSDTGSTAVTATIKYTNDLNQDSRTTTVALAATRRASTFLPILPNTSDARIKSIQSVTLSATTGTAGSFGVTAIRRNAELPLLVAGVGAVADFAALALPELVGSECLFLLLLCGSTSTGNVLGSMEVISA